MESILLQFIDTLDASLKKMQARAGEGAGMNRLTINQFRYLEAVAALDHPTVTELAERLNITKASVTAGVNKLIALGYLVKTRSAVDHRVHHVKLTEASAELVRAKFETLQAYNGFILSTLSKEEVDQFERILSKLVSVFKQSA